MCHAQLVLEIVWWVEGTHLWKISSEVKGIPSIPMPAPPKKKNQALVRDYERNHHPLTRRLNNRTAIFWGTRGIEGGNRYP